MAVIGAFSFVACLLLLLAGIVFKVKKKGKAKNMFLFSLAAFILFVVMIVMSPVPDKSATAKNAKESVEFKIVKDIKFKKTEQRQVRVTTEKTSEKDLEEITKEIQEQYKGKGLDSLHLFIHSPKGDAIGEFKAHAFIAYTQKGAIQVGVEKPNTYRIETN
ncbi:hypothetical protein [Bacillus nitratireducens]|uniref:hypothetical protein n=1 Tax=Bacillus nitratireducens TaxID=2026193 RepID=UPI0033969507